MKRNIKRLAVFAIIAAIAMFMTTMASADDRRGKNTIHAKYAVTGAGSCLIAIDGFNTSLQPKTGAWFWGSMVLDEGVYTFNKDGTGSVSITLHETDLFNPAMGVPPCVGTATENYNFIYTVDKGMIAFTYVTGSYEADWTDGPNAGIPLYGIIPPWNGVLSQDGKTLYISFQGPPIFHQTVDKDNLILTPVEALCNIDFQGFWVGP